MRIDERTFSRAIKYVEFAIQYENDTKAILDHLTTFGIKGYDAFLIYKAGEVSVRMSEKYPLPETRRDKGKEYRDKRKT